MPGGLHGESLKKGGVHSTGFEVIFKANGMKAYSGDGAGQGKAKYVHIT
jgi:hypothetical protein